ncbi:MAG TPA: M1 family metallopeptidase [Thermoanaerobaculia bacterium]|jgi:alanyl aminopeptidase
MRRALALLLLATAPAALAAAVRLGSDVVPASQSIALHTDPRGDSYRGSVSVDLDVRKATSTFRFHAQSLSIVSLRLSQGARPIDAAYSAAEGDTVLVKTGERLQPGRYSLAIDFTNQYNRQAVGLYRMTVKDGTPYLYTQFQAVDARRAFPAWDEPGIKMPYELTVTIPAQYDAVSNTPVASETKSGDAKTIRFARTKPLPSYLLALAVGQFDYTPIEGMSVPGRVVAPKGQGHLAGTAASITPGVLAALEQYFGGKYPFEKVDLIAVPEYWAGAMENPGAITYRDTILLLDPNAATPNQKQNLVRVTAHELAHMWFGDLVTMEWWDDFWLNESFADWMGDKITDQLYPEFEHALSEIPSIQRVMNTDARVSTDPIRRIGQTPEEAMRNVGLAYDKGKGVLQMFEQWIGPEKFRQGVLAHIEANAWGNANATEFFASLSKHAPAGTSKALETFIAQAGIPLVRAELTSPSTVRLTQRRFSTGQAKPATWRIPVTLRTNAGTQAVLLDTPSKTVRLDAPAEWVYPHGNAAGYYRWQMDDASMAALAKRATQILNPAERLAFVGNLGALFRTGELQGDEYLTLLQNFAADTSPQVAGELMNALENVRTTFDTPRNRPRFAAYLRRTLGPALTRIGLTPKAGEPHTVTIMRPELIAMLAEYGEDETVWHFVRGQLTKVLADPKSVDPSLANVVVSLAGSRGDEKLWEEYRTRFENPSSPSERSRFLSGLRQFSDPELRKKTREYALSASVRPTDLFTLVADTDSEEDREDLYQWMTANYDAVMKKLPPNFAANSPFIAGGCDPARVARAKEFFAARKAQGTERALARVEEQVRECSMLRTREMAAVERFLGGQ